MIDVDLLAKALVEEGGFTRIESTTESEDKFFADIDTGAVIAIDKYFLTIDDSDYSYSVTYKIKDLYDFIVKKHYLALLYSRGKRLVEFEFSL